MSKIKVVGLTGQTGAGKSEVSQIFKRNGFAVINADLTARQVVAPGSPCLEEIFSLYGDDVRNPDDSLNRRALAEIVFSDKEELSRYNALIFPYINKLIGKQILSLEKSGTEWLLLDAPTLFESRANRLCNCIVSVTAPAAIRLRRITERDGIPEKAAKQRMQSQLSEAFFRSHSDYVICNDADLGALEAAAGEVVCQILAKFNHTERKSSHGK